MPGFDGQGFSCGPDGLGNIPGIKVSLGELDDQRRGIRLELDGGLVRAHSGVGPAQGRAAVPQHRVDPHRGSGFRFVAGGHGDPRCQDVPCQVEAPGYEVCPPQRFLIVRVGALALDQCGVVLYGQIVLLVHHGQPSRQFQNGHRSYSVGQPFFDVPSGLLGAPGAGKHLADGYGGGFVPLVELV